VDSEYSVGEAINLFDLAAHFALGGYVSRVRVQFASEHDAQMAQMMLGVCGSNAPREAMKNIKAYVISQDGRVSSKPWYEWLRGCERIDLTPTPPSRQRVRQPTRASVQAAGCAG